MYVYHGTSVELILFLMLLTLNYTSLHCFHFQHLKHFEKKSPRLNFLFEGLDGTLFILKAFIRLSSFVEIKFSFIVLFPLPLLALCWTLIIWSFSNTTENFRRFSSNNFKLWSIKGKSRSGIPLFLLIITLYPLGLLCICILLSEKLKLTMALPNAS